MPQLQTQQGMVRVPAGTWKVDRDHSSVGFEVKDQTRQVEMEATVQGAGEDPWGNERVGVAVRGTINRTDWGLTWQQKLAAGGMLVGEEVTVLIDVSAVRT